MPIPRSSTVLSRTHPRPLRLEQGVPIPLLNTTTQHRGGPREQRLPLHSPRPHLAPRVPHPHEVRLRRRRRPQQGSPAPGAAVPSGAAGRRGLQHHLHGGPGPPDPEGALRGPPLHHPARQLPRHGGADAPDPAVEPVDPRLHPARGGRPLPERHAAEPGGH